MKLIFASVVSLLVALAMVSGALAQQEVVVNTPVLTAIPTAPGPAVVATSSLPECRKGHWTTPDGLYTKSLEICPINFEKGTAAVTHYSTRVGCTMFNFPAVAKETGPNSFTITIVEKMPCYTSFFGIFTRNGKEIQGELHVAGMKYGNLKVTLR